VQGLGTPVTLLIGDISFLHDLNSLTLLQGMEQPLHIVVVNNNGGGIFSFLPVATEKDIFETNFGTPQNYSIRAAAETFGISYNSPSSPESFKASYADLSRSAVSGIIEVNGSREENLAEHRRVNKQLRNIIDRHI
ncbi:MAG: 2-succinyl-5-enolpyruvyl-6-hydroxy-3-cyclohexene-1-carboxylate synthase, partial [Chlorobium phaeobacteroides]|nr:2-succinyl-5-enolpyruvyl-6-hydroxy-3-cyclohexene-1-carboxylate synthase [Chlorobium phaeobacteroides]